MIVAATPLKLLTVACIILFAPGASSAATADDLAAAANPEGAGFSTVRLARIAAWYQAHVDPEHVHGAVVAIARNGLRLAPACGRVEA